MATTLWQRLRTRRPDSWKTHSAPRVLIITAFTWDQAFFRCLAESGDWNFSITASVAEALELTSTHEFPIIVCDRDLPGWEWREIQATLIEHSPRSCFLLSTRVSDDYLWREVIGHGGYDLLAKPLDPATVTRTLQRAWYYWKAEPPAA